MAEEIMLLKEIIDHVGNKYKNVKELYEEYKRLREKLGRPIEHPLDPERIKKDLSSDDFFNFLEELKVKK